MKEMSNEKSTKLFECGNAPGKPKWESQDYPSFDLKGNFTTKRVCAKPASERRRGRLFMEYLVKCCRILGENRSLTLEYTKLLMFDDPSRSKRPKNRIKGEQSFRLEIAKKQIPTVETG